MKTVPSQRPFSLKEVQSNVLDSQHLKALQPVEYKTLQSILHEIGGTGAFVFLFARVRGLEERDVYMCSTIQTSCILARNSHYSSSSLHAMLFL